MAQGMATLWRINKKSPSEFFISWSVLNKSLKILISNTTIRVIERNTNLKIYKTIDLINVGECEYSSKVKESGRIHLLSISIYDNPPPIGHRSSFKPSSRPTFMCQTEKISLKVRQDIQYAIDLRNEAAFRVMNKR